MPFCSTCLRTRKVDTSMGTMDQSHSCHLLPASPACTTHLPDTPPFATDPPEFHFLFFSLKKMEGGDLDVLRAFADSDCALMTALVDARARLAATKPALSRANTSLPTPRKTPVRPPSPLRNSQTKTVGQWSS